VSAPLLLAYGSAAFVLQVGLATAIAVSCHRSADDEAGERGEGREHGKGREHDEH
jgi:hypothetical protein